MRMKKANSSIFPLGSSIKDKKISETFTEIGFKSITPILFLEAQCFEERRSIHH